MARAGLTPQEVSRSGLVHTFVAVDQANGNEFVNDEKTFLYVKNAGVGSTNVTISTPGTVDGLAISDLVVAVANGVNKLIGPFPKRIYNQGNGKVYVDWSVGTSVTVAVIRLP